MTASIRWINKNIRNDMSTSRLIVNPNDIKDRITINPTIIDIVKLTKNSTPTSKNTSSDTIIKRIIPTINEK